jgi:hypothetical protein
MKCNSKYIFLVTALSLSAAGPGGCDSPQCPRPRQFYRCYVSVTPSAPCDAVCPNLTTEIFDEPDLCALGAIDAWEQELARWAQRGYAVIPRPLGDGTLCMPSTNVGFGPQSVGLEPLTVPACDPSDGDDTCLACVKAACCDSYQGCSNDLGCLCWVSCKFGGNTDATCAEPTVCGALDPVASAAVSCLNANCPAECGTMATMVGACMCQGVSTGGSGAGGGGSFGDGVGGSSDVGGVGAVGSSGDGSSVDVGTGPSGGGSFGQSRRWGRGGAGGAW